MFPDFEKTIQGETEMKIMTRYPALIFASMVLVISLTSCSDGKAVPDTSPAAVTQTEKTSVTTTVETTKALTDTVPETKPVTLADLQKELTLKNYPVVDGSTATIPLAIGLVQKITGCTEAEDE